MKKYFKIKSVWTEISKISMLLTITHINCIPFTIFYLFINITCYFDIEYKNTNNEIVFFKDIGFRFRFISIAKSKIIQGGRIIEMYSLLNLVFFNSVFPNF